MSKVSGVKRKKVPTKKPSSTPCAPTRRFLMVPFYGAASTARKMFNEMAEGMHLPTLILASLFRHCGSSCGDFTRCSGGSNNVVADFVNLLGTDTVDIEQAPITGFDYKELRGDMDEHDGEDEVEEVDEGTYQQSQAKKSVGPKNHTILEHKILIKAWSTMSMDACTGVSQTVKMYWQRIEDQYFQLMAKYPNRTAQTFQSLQGRWDVIKPACSRWTAGLEQVRNAPSSETVESDYEKIAQHRYKDIEDSEGKFFKLEHCWKMLKDCDKWKLFDRESPPKRGPLMNMDEDEDDDGPRNLNKPDGDKKTKEKIKREHEASSLRDKIDAMVQSNEVMLAKSLEIKIELAEKKARENQERWKLLKDVEERRARAVENKTMANLLAEENRIMTLNRNDMDNISKEYMA
ncbi:Lactation elevated protein 1 [Hordeum vulgare]|nr:Lactation elevated protein 1 [Hordeum vulgare]